MYLLAVSGPFNIFVVIVVIVNTVQMIMLTSPYAQSLYGPYVYNIYFIQSIRTC